MPCTQLDASGPTTRRPRISVGVPGREQLHEAVGVAHGDVAVDEPVLEDGDPIRHLLLAGLLLVQTHARHLGLQEHDGGEGLVADRVRLQAEHQLGGVAALQLGHVDEGDIHGGVAGSIDVGNAGSRLIHHDSTVAIDGDAHVFEAETGGVGRAADGDEGVLDADGLLALRRGDDVLDLAVVDAHRDQLALAVDVDAHLLEVRGHAGGDVLVLEGEDPGLAIDDVDPALAEVGEDGGVLAADDAGADDHEAPREALPALDVIARDDVPAVDLDAVGDARLGAGGDDEVVGLVARQRSICGSDLDRMR
ncbi:MAG: hypothetical protein QM820_21280 [Minicystis sp.]